MPGKQAIDGKAFHQQQQQAGSSATNLGVSGIAGVKGISGMWWNEVMISDIGRDLEGSGLLGGRRK